MTCTKNNLRQDEVTFLEKVLPEEDAEVASLTPDTEEGRVVTTFFSLLKRPRRLEGSPHNILFLHYHQVTKLLGSDSALLP